MNRGIYPLLLLALCSPVLRNCPAAAPTADGIYATFIVSRAGSTVGEFHCSLDYEKAPRTVANFVGLAEGTRNWVDFRKSGLTRRSFYDGLTFHRVIPGFVAQAGSPDGTGGDGPGYTFRDEFHSELRHSTAGILSMANSGLHSNGSQFFITLAATAHLDDLHSVLGATAAANDLAIVQSIAAGDLIESVTITRNGAAAQAFDVNAHGLPAVENAEASIAKTATGFELSYQQRDSAQYFAQYTSDLTNWTRLTDTELYFTPPPQTTRDVSAISSNESRQFFSVTRVQYPDDLITPEVGAGQRIALTNPQGYSLTFDLANATTGTFTTSFTPQSTHQILSYRWNREAYRGQLVATISGLVFGTGERVVQLNVSLDFDNTTTGTIAGNLIGEFGTPSRIEGAFVLSDL